MTTSSSTFLLLCTVAASADTEDRLDALRRSLQDQDEVGVTLLVVVRESDTPAERTETDDGVRTVWLHVVGAHGLSSARNIGLAHARASGLLDRCQYVHFADDDEVVPPGTLAAVRDVFEREQDADVVVGAYGPSLDEVNRVRWPVERADLDVFTIPTRVSSATAYYRSALVRSLGGFDERFGLGSRFGSGEDVDYALRAAWQGSRVRYEWDLVVLHPYRPDSPQRNYPGTVALFAKHAVRRRQAKRMFVRIVKHGLREVRAGRMQARTLARAGRAAVLGALHGARGERRSAGSADTA